MPVERAQRDSPGSFSGLDEPKPECVTGVVGGPGGLGTGNDSVTKIVNKRFIRQTAGEEMVSIMGGGKETGSGTEVRPFLHLKMTIPMVVLLSFA